MKKLAITISVLALGFFLLIPVSTLAQENTEECVTATCTKILDLPESWKTSLTATAVVGGAIVDAINPCAFAVFILLFASLMTARGKKRALQGGLFFALAVFLSYFSMGFGLVKILKEINISSTALNIVGIFAIIIGLLNIKDYFGYERGPTMEVPQSWRPKMKTLIRGVTTPQGSFLVGLLVSLFLLPCTSGPYVIILSLLAKQNSLGLTLGYLLLYNLVFILPFILITAIMYFGFSAMRAEELRQRKIRLLHLIAGIILTLLGIAILLGLFKF
ncbi:MAG: hypothetical protein COU85_00920 [Candidatus Portnoybacteria bacterium CG10_big_fil_rev_8_21_14_0_10_44_7]|uniref:Uncharacterized protein n=1 Tax=Candidatus Portnoybacteria bacterium CG10_big_fil_rev_8_21_14_0_10_44_7 TaxID=1974816 RepID=A0A2M8KJ57_9BACT|nr:MAG: hypothetical protein COU85_00920 [Candidatus Portnoybacteria bacterium CG10_big_fil_rev_8_21_14_0_10_44_7]